MTGRERIRRVLLRQTVDRVPVADFLFMPETIRRWQQEGLPNGADPVDFFDLDLKELPVDSSLRRQVQVITETEDYIIQREEDGVVRKRWKRYAAEPDEVDFPLKEPRDFKQIQKELQPDESRLPEGASQITKRAHEQERFVFLSTIEPCALARRLMGPQRWLDAFASKPLLLTDIMDAGAKLILEMYEMTVKAGIEVDGILLRGDLAYSHGPFMSPKDYLRLVLPIHRELCAQFRGLKIPVLWYCRGKVEEFLKVAHKAGFAALMPLEARSGNDLAHLKKRYGKRVVLGGNVAIEKLSGSREEVEREVLGKLQIGMAGGGYLFACDHPLPPSVSLENYSYALQLVRKHGIYDKGARR